MPAKSSSFDLKILTTCSQCGSKDVDMVCVPGGWMQLLCQGCHNEWWVESHLHLP